MPTLRFVRENKSSGLLLLGIVEEGESARYTVNASLYFEIGTPCVGDELDEGQMSAIRYTDEYLRAKQKALNILALADNSKKNLSLKLRRAGFNREITELVCDEMTALGYIDERNQLERLIAVEANIKLRGPKKIIPWLAAKGYSVNDIKRVLSELIESGEIDFKDNAKKLLEKKLCSGLDEEKIQTILYKNGF